MSGQGQSYERSPRWTAVDTYSFTHLHPPHSHPTPSTLTHVLENSAHKNLPDIAVSPSQGKFLKLQAQIARARNILEVGTLGGYSTIWLARALPEGGSLTSLELDEECLQVSQRNPKSPFSWASAIAHKSRNADAFSPEGRERECRQCWAF